MDAQCAKIEHASVVVCRVSIAFEHDIWGTSRMPQVKNIDGSLRKHNHFQLNEWHAVRDFIRHNTRTRVETLPVNKDLFYFTYKNGDELHWPTEREGYGQSHSLCQNRRLELKPLVLAWTSQKMNCSALCLYIGPIMYLLLLWLGRVTCLQSV